MILLQLLTKTVIYVFFILISAYVFLISKKDTGIIFDYVVTAAILVTMMVVV